MPKKTSSPKFTQKLSLNVGFHEAMQVLADHANVKGTKKITYKSRKRIKK